MIEIDKTEMKQIEDFPRYFIDKKGNIYNDKGLKLKQQISSSGYLRVSLCNNKIKHKMFLVHRLVAKAFIPNPNCYTQVNHKDYNKQNNNVENLEWVTPLQNLNYSNIIEKASKAKFKRVKCNETGEIFESIKDACEKYNLYHSNIVACCNGRRKRTGGYSWSYHK